MSNISKRLFCLLLLVCSSSSAFAYEQPMTIYVTDNTSDGSGDAYVWSTVLSAINWNNELGYDAFSFVQNEDDADIIFSIRSDNLKVPVSDQERIAGNLFEPFFLENPFYNDDVYTQSVDWLDLNKCFGTMYSNNTVASSQEEGLEIENALLTCWQNRFWDLYFGGLVD